MTQNTISEIVSFLEFLYDLPCLSWHLRHHIMTIRIDLFSERVEWSDSLRLEIFLETCEHRTYTIDKRISLNSHFQFHSSFERIYLREEGEEYL